MGDVSTIAQIVPAEYLTFEDFLSSSISAIRALINHFTFKSPVMKVYELPGARIGSCARDKATSRLTLMYKLLIFKAILHHLVPHTGDIIALITDILLY